MRSKLSARVSIRPATQTDLTAIGKLGALLVRSHHDFDPKRFLPVTSATTQVYRSFGTQLEEPLVVACIRGLETVADAPMPGVEPAAIWRPELWVA